jgi:HAE1 family hydrophobic/amphiphilic exporter-1
MKGLVKGTINRPVSVLMCVIALVVFFITSMTKISLKLNPDITMPIIVIFTPYPGASPEEVDELVSAKISNACESLSGVKEINTYSSEGSSEVDIEYNYGQNMDKAYNDLREAVDGVKSELPKDAKTSTLVEVTMDNFSSDMTLSVTGKTDMVDVRSEVENHVIPELKKANNLAKVDVSGGDEKYIRIQVIPEYLQQYGLSLSGIASAIESTNFSMPAGTATYGDQAMNLSAQVKYDTMAKLEKVPITTSKGQTIYLSDIATVRYGVSDKSSISRYMGSEDVGISIKRKQSSSPVSLSREVKPMLEDIREKNPNLNIVIENDAADTIIDTLKGVAKTMVEAILLAMLIIFIFFGDIKGSLIVGSTMPISIMAAIICMQMAGISLNIVTMAALIIAIGMMTDNAVVVIEMCFRRHQAGLSFKDAAYEGTVIVMNAVIGSTITTLVVYFPLTMMQGMSAQMFKPLALTIIFSLTASLISAILLIPICFTTYKPVEHRDIITNRILKKISRKYKRVLRFALKWKKSVLCASIALLVLTVFLATFLKTSLYPANDEGIINIELTFRPNLDVYAMDGTVQEIEKFVADSGYIKNYNSSVSRENSTGSVTAHKIKDIDLTTQEIVDKWNVELRNVSPICEVHVSAASSGMGSNDAMQEYDITANSLEELQAASNELVEKLEATEGVLYVTSTFKDAGAKASVEIDPVLASSKGFTAKELADLVYKNMSGAKATDINIDNKKYEVRVKYPDGYFDTVGDVENMTFINSKGVSVPLTEMAKITFEAAPVTVDRQEGRFIDYIKVTMTADTKDDVVEVLDAIVDDFLASDDRITPLLSQEDRMMKEELTSVAVAIVLAIFLVFFVMAVQFESVIVSLLIMLCVPFAGIGSILFMLVTGIKVDMVSSMGILMLAGIVVNNGIILIDMTMQNQKAGMDTVEALVDAGSGRLRPILMTTLTTIIAMIPVAFGLAKDAMMMQGMAAVIVGGLVASTILTLVLLPTYYLILDRVRVRSAERRERRREKLEQKVVEQESILKEKQKADARVNLVFPMAGAGTRFLGDTFDCPKPLIDIDGLPFFKRAADSLIGHVKCERMIFVVLKQHVEKYEIDEKIHSFYPDAKIVQLPEVLPGALMTAVEGAKAIHNEYPVIFADCDMMFTSSELYDYYNSDDYDAAGTLLTFESDKDCYSYVETGEWTDANGETVDVAVRTAEKEVISEKAITGAYGFINASVFIRAAEKYINNTTADEYYLSGVYNDMIKAGRRVRVFDTDTFLSFGTPDEYRKAEIVLRKHREKIEAEGENYIEEEIKKKKPSVKKTQVKNESEDKKADKNPDSKAADEKQVDKKAADDKESEKKPEKKEEKAKEDKKKDGKDQK